MSQSPIPLELRQLVAERAHHCCCYCLTQEEVVGMRFTIDHIIAESLGGQTTDENLCLACWDCNLIKNKRIAAIDPDTGNMVPSFIPISGAGMNTSHGWNKGQSSWELHPTDALPSKRCR